MRALSPRTESGRDVGTIKYDAEGNELWAATQEGPVGGYDYAADIEVDDAGDAYVTGWVWTGGSAEGGTDADYATLKYGLDGSLHWIIYYDGTGNRDNAKRLVLDRSGDLLVGGTSSGGSDAFSDFAIVKYEQIPRRPFLRGDWDESGDVSVQDVLQYLAYLFERGEGPTCLDAVDCNDDGIINVSDAVYGLCCQYLEGVEMPAPGSVACGLDPTPDTLTCKSFAGCP